MTELTLRRKEQLWLTTAVITTVLVGVASLLCFTHIAVSVYGFTITKRFYEHTEIDMKLSRMAWMSEYVCSKSTTYIDNITRSIVIQCPSVDDVYEEASRRYNVTEVDAYEIAAGRAYDSISINILYLAPWNLSRAVWTWQQLKLKELYERIVGPWLLLLVLSFPLYLLTKIPVHAFRNFQRLAALRHKTMNECNRNLSDVMSDLNASTNHGYPSAPYDAQNDAYHNDFKRQLEAEDVDSTEGNTSSSSPLQSNSVISRILNNGVKRRVVTPFQQQRL